MKTEWWYDDATFHYSGDSDLYLALLTVEDDGTTRLTLPERVREFTDEDDASIWLVDEEYRRLDGLIADLVEDGIPVDPRITATAATTLSDQMVIKLQPALETIARAKPHVAGEVVKFVDRPPENVVTK